MLLGLTYQLMRFITDLVLIRARSDVKLRAEVLALRHQLRVLERKVGKPAWQPADRMLLATLSRLLPRSSLRVTSSPQTHLITRNIRRGTALRSRASWRRSSGDLHTAPGLDGAGRGGDTRQPATWIRDGASLDACLVARRVERRRIGNRPPQAELASDSVAWRS